MVLVDLQSFSDRGHAGLTCAPSVRGICVMRFRSPQEKNIRGCHLCTKPR